MAKKKQKVCPGCGQLKLLGEFHRARKTPDGYRYECKSCVKANTNNEAKREYNRQWRSTHPERAMLNAARARARASGLAFNIEVSDIVIPDICPALGIPIFRGERSNPNSPALDRVNNHLGYVKGNVVVVSHRANTIKRDASVAELRALADFYEAQAEKVS